MLTTTIAELEAAYADCVKRRGQEEAQDILSLMARVDNIADVPEKRRFLTAAALSRRPPQNRASASNDNPPAHTLDSIRARAFGKMRGEK